ncbi:unnamed protein product [Toxocara canis]|uniref:VPS37 C-terminal domain-containing protein n=1 Tax=Toxocara canis TaxID=6265 RepID=A0A183UZT7_TOXCA|nr:unnamed protein product [Toxocara canis]
MGDPTYESLLEMSVSAAMAQVRNMSNEQLNALLSDNSKIDAIIENIPQVRTLPTEREMGLVQNKSLAEWNLSQEPKLEEAKKKLLNTYEQAVSVKAEVEELKAKLDSMSEQRSLDTSSALLQAATQSAEDDSEAIADRFMKGEIDVDQFIKEFIEKKTLAHMRRIKSEKLLAILRQQQYTAPTQPMASSPPYPSHGGVMTGNLAKIEVVEHLVVKHKGMSVNRLSRLAATQCRSLSTLRDRAIQLEPKYLYEPKFEDPRVYPEYDLINVRLQGYDYVPLEKFQSYVHKIAKRFKFEIVESYAVAAKTERVVVYKPNSTLVESEIELATYDRVIRIAKVPTVRLPLFIFLIHTHLPIGVKLTVKGHEKADEDYRYIPDLLLKQKQEELKSLDDPLVRKNLGWE